MKRTPIIFLLILFSCVPAQTINKQTEVIPKPLLGGSTTPVWRETFKFQEPSGPMDFFFLVVNSISSPEFNKSFRSFYTRFLTKLSKYKHIDYFFNLGESPCGLISTIPFTPETSLATHMDEIYRDPYSNIPFGRLLYGYPKPFQDTQRLIRTYGQRREGIPLFIAYFMAEDMKFLTVDDVPATIALSSTQALLGSRNYSQIFSFERIKKGPYAICADGKLTKNYEFAMTKAFGANAKIMNKQNLCDNDWENKEDLILQKMEDYRKRIFISRGAPKNPLMSVYVEGQKYRYGQDYSYNHESREVTFIDSGDMNYPYPTKGDSIEVYYMEKQLKEMATNNFEDGETYDPFINYPGSLPEQ
jgi:hypothetical protein